MQREQSSTLAKAPLIAVVVVALVVSQLLVLTSSESAYALDDLGVVSGDTFELPGYNDGPSGGGVWPGSSGSGGEVGPMPLPGSIPDTGGVPHGGPGGGGAGTGREDGPKVDRTRPPYLSPRSRLSVTAKSPFDTVTVFPKLCGSEAKSQRSGIPIQTAGPSSSDSPLVRTEKTLVTLATEIGTNTNAMVIGIVRYAEAFKAGVGEAGLEYPGAVFGSAVAVAGISLDRAGRLIDSYTDSLIYGRGCESADPARRLLQARMYLAVHDSVFKTFQRTDKVLELSRDVEFYDDRLMQALYDISDWSMQFGSSYKSLASGFMKAHSARWADHYRAEIKELKGRISGTSN